MITNYSDDASVKERVGCAACLASASDSWNGEDGDNWQLMFSKHEQMSMRPREAVDNTLVFFR